VKYFPGADAPANKHNGDQQCRGNQQADLQPEEWKDQQAHQRKGTHPCENGKHHIIKVTCKSPQHDISWKFKLYTILWLWFGSTKRRLSHFGIGFFAYIRNQALGFQSLTKRKS
jgi:hypothetical protein